MHNPGLSPEAWKQYVRFLAQMNIKYGAKATARIHKVAA